MTTQNQPIMRHHSIKTMHPGELLREEILPSMPISKTAFARAMQISRQTLYDIINERQPVSAEMAVRLGKFLGNGPHLWINLQRTYDLAVAQENTDVSGIAVFEPAE